MLSIRLSFIFIVASLFICNYTSCQSNSEKINYGNNTDAGHFLNTRGFNMYYETYGNGEPLLFIHGNGGSINAFTNNIPFFSRYYKVIAVDSRAHGRSGDVSDSLSFEMMADDFNALLDSLHIKNAYVIGWSDGGINGLLLAIRHPDKVKKLAITGANLTADTLGLNPDVYYSIKNESESLHKKNLTPKLKNQIKITDLDLYQPNISLTQLHTIQCPTLVIGGDHDLIPVKHTVQIAQNIPNAFLWILPNTGHSTLITRKDQFNSIVFDFFKNSLKAN